MYQSPRRTASPKTTANPSKPVVSPRRWVEDTEEQRGGSVGPSDNDLEHHRQVFLVYANGTMPKTPPPPAMSPSSLKKIMNNKNNKKDSTTTKNQKPSEATWSHPFPPSTSTTMGNPVQVWAYEDQQTPESLKRMKEQQTHPIGVWGTTTNSRLVFVPPHQTPPSSFTPRGTWTFPLIPRKEHLLAEDQAGFLKVGDYVPKEDPLDVSGTWRLLCHRPGGDEEDDDVAVPTSPTPKSPLSKSARSSPSPHKASPKTIRVHVRDNTGGPASNNNPLITLRMKPTVDTIGDIKSKLHDKTGIPPREQRLSRPLLDRPRTRKDGAPPTPTPQQVLLLNDAPTLREAGIQDGDILSLDPMEIYVQEEGKDGGNRYTLCPVHPHQTIAEIKRQLIDHHLPPPSPRKNSPNKHVKQIQLTFESTPCVDDKTLQQHGIQHQSTLILKEEPPTPMIVYVKIPASSRPHKGRGSNPASPVTIPIEVEPTDTIQSLQEKIEDLKDIPVDDQRLFFRNKPLVEPKATLDDENIHHGDILDLELPTPMVIHVRTPHG